MQKNYIRHKQGFTLTEIAIVLGIIGLILGAVWVAATGVYNNQKSSKANTQIMRIVQGVRSLYGTSAVTGSADGTDVTVNFCKAGVFPSDTYPSTCASVYNPWSGATAGTYVQTTSVSAASAQDGFDVIMTNVSQSGCISLLTSLGSNPNGLGGLFFLSATGATNTEAGAVALYTVATGTTFPITVTTAAGLCTSTTGNAIIAVYKLKG